MGMAEAIRAVRTRRASSRAVPDVDHASAPQPDPVSWPVRRIARDDHGVRLVLADGREVRIGAQPDADAGSRVGHRVRRIIGVDLVITSDTAGAHLRAVGHHCPCTLPIAISTALGLACAGTPITVSLPAGSDA
jgi:hypothetical protein